MKRLVACLCPLIAAFALAACSKEPQPPAQSAPQPPVGETSPATERPTTVSEGETVPQESESTPAETMTETDEAAETEAPATTTQPSLRLGANPPGPPTSAHFKEGTHYKKVVPAQPTSIGPGKVEVLEVFWYGCPHCFVLDPAIESWRSTGKPAYVQFVRLPAMWNDQLRMHARLFYTAEALGKLEELHTPIFREIQMNANALETVEKITAFFRQHGVSPEEFQTAFSSFAVESKLQRAEVLNRRYRVQSVPLMIVNGKYSVDASSAGGEQPLFTLVNELAASEHGG
jgi:thiol:disulfide interchange protein DsbA